MNRVDGYGRRSENAGKRARQFASILSVELCSVTLVKGVTLVTVSAPGLANICASVVISRACVAFISVMDRPSLLLGQRDIETNAPLTRSASLDNLSAKL